MEYPTSYRTIQIDGLSIFTERPARRRADADPVGGANRHYGLNNFAHREPLDELNPLHEWVTNANDAELILRVS
jgi:hypothetical protein